MENNKRFKWQCICCEKEIPVHPDGQFGDDNSGLFPSLEGGTIEISFGFGSKFDQIRDLMSPRDIRIQSAICDKCFETKKDLTRKVEIIKSVSIKNVQ